MSVATQAIIVGGTPKRFGSLAETSAYTGISIRALRSLIALGTLTAYRPGGGGKIVLDLKEVERHIRASSKRGSSRGMHLAAINEARRAGQEVTSAEQQ